jgi:thiol-disulfide isomerase/thioredoxin
MLKKFIITSIIFVIISIAISLIRFFTVYDGNMLKLKNRMSALSTPIDLSLMEVIDLKGNVHRIEEFNGKPKIVMFWATWCKYCREEIPHIERFLNQHGQDVSVLSLAVPTDTPEGIRRYIAQINVKEFTSYIDPTGSIFNSLKVPGIPYYAIVDSQGKAVATLRPKWNEDLKKLLSEIK